MTEESLKKRMEKRLAELKPLYEQRKVEFLQLDALVAELEVLLGIKEPTLPPEIMPPEAAPPEPGEVETE
jgi:hypothetical protein